MGKIEQRFAGKVVLDAGPIIHLNELNCLGLLSDFNKLIVPVSVWEEVNYYQPAALQNKKVLFKKTRMEENFFEINSIY